MVRSGWRIQAKIQKQRVVGWRDGIGLTMNDVKEIIRKEGQAHREYKSVKKAIAKVKSREVVDPLANLPPTWQAFWSTVPHLDPKAAFRQHQRDENKLDKVQKPVNQDDREREKSDEVLDTAALEQEVHRNKEILEEKQRLCHEWDQKLMRVRYLDAEEEERAKKLQKRHENASYVAGVMEGKVRSSDLYFQLLFEDKRKAHAFKNSNMVRSVNLMESDMIALHNEVRICVKTAVEPQATTPPSQLSIKDG